MDKMLGELMRGGKYGKEGDATSMNRWLRREGKRVGQ